MRGTALHDRLVLAGAALFFCAHLAWLPRHLEDIDSINFALGLREYDVAAHQPHPPGYPVFTVMARMVAATLSPWIAGPTTRAAVAMSVLAAIAAVVALLALYATLRVISGTSPRTVDPATSLQATALTAVTPLFWVTASRPLSDMVGLAGALTCQWLLLRGVASGAIRAAVLAAAACGVAVGLRSQVTWLVMPMLAWLLARVWRREGLRTAFGVAAAAIAGVLVWAIPMVTITGGIAAYRTALTSQVGEDFEGVPMLALQPGLRRLAIALADTFVSPWGWWPFAAMAIVLALAGVVAVKRDRVAAWFALGFLPYLVYHLLFQETETTRYALPLMPMVAVLVVRGCRAWTGRLATPIVAATCFVAAAVSLQAHRQYVTTGATVAETLRDMNDAALRSQPRPQVLMHRRVWAETRRARAALAPAPPYDVLPAPRALEWQGATHAWDANPAASLWWLVDPRRGDRVAVDPRALHLRRHVAWPMPLRALLGGMRPHAFDWFVVEAPTWMLLDGWGLTPELAGLSAAAGQGPSSTGARALVRTDGREATMVLGGRVLASSSGAPVSLDVAMGSSWQQHLEVPTGPFAYTWALPAGSVKTDAGHYATLVVRARAGGQGGERVLLEQFDVQPAGTPVVARERGWYEPERDPATGRQWRWIADTSSLRIAGAGGNVRLVVTGTYPRHLERPPVLEMLAGNTRIATQTLTRPFRVEQLITAEQLRADGGRLTWRVRPSFVAGERTGTADARRLALEIATLDVQALR